MTSDNSRGTNRQKLVNLTVAGVVSQVGCVTLVIILGALFLGLYLDGKLDTRPWFTIGILLASIPLSLVIMVYIVRTFVKKIKPESPKQPVQEENKLEK